MAAFTQMNIKIEPEWVKEIDRLAEEHGWSRARAIRVAIHALTALMKAHETYADQHDDDIAKVYMRLAREMPAGFVEVPKDGVRVGRAGDLPAVMVDNWLVFPDRETGALLAENQAPEGPRVARVMDGEIKPLKLPSAAGVAAFN